MKQKLDIGRIGEKVAELELLKLGFDVINLNDFRKNYENADLICINPTTGKSVMIQVKTGTTKKRSETFGCFMKNLYLCTRFRETTSAEVSAIRFETRKGA